MELTRLPTLKARDGGVDADAASEAAMPGTGRCAIAAGAGVVLAVWSLGVAVGLPATTCLLLATSSSKPFFVH